MIFIVSELISETILLSGNWMNILMQAPENNQKPKRFAGILLHLHPQSIRREAIAFNRTFGLGGMAALLIVIQVITGIMLRLYYEPLPQQAYDSILHLQNNVLFGQLIRNIHHWCGVFLVIIAFLHLLRVFFAGGFQLIEKSKLDHWLSTFHSDNLFKLYWIPSSVVILMAMGAPVKAGNPYKTSKTQGGFVAFGGPHILGLVTEVATRALKAVWYQKWFVHRRLRPEEYAGRVHLRATGQAAYPLHSDVLHSAALGRVQARTGTALLPMAYPEGCPSHPAYGAGHNAIAGACATVLKIFFDEAAVLPNPVVPDSAGQTLQPYDGPPLTVGGELNKLASNIALGRDVAGVHYRSDGAEGLLLGEAVAVGIVRDTLHCYSERLTEFSFTSFDGTPVVLAP